MLNKYTHRFTIKCPVNDKVIQYTLVIETCARVMVEDIVQQVASLDDTGFHEDVADQLAHLLPGLQTLYAHHHGVDIETVRGGL